jgi:hypothetical protein
MTDVWPGVALGASFEPGAVETLYAADVDPHEIRFAVDGSKVTGTHNGVPVVTINLGHIYDDLNAHFSTLWGREEAGQVVRPIVPVFEGVLDTFNSLPEGKG